MTTFMQINKRVVNWDFNEADVEEEPVATPVPSSPQPAPALVVPVSPTRSLVAEPRQVPGSRVFCRTRNGNGHRSEMVRKLNDSERAWLKNKFLQKNGQIANDDCVAFKGQIISDCIAIFQITGYVSVLHRYVALGRLELRNLPAYLSWMHEKYRGLWSQWNNARFVRVREANQSSRRAGRQPAQNIPLDEEPIQTSDGILSTVPTFKAFPRRRAYAMASA